MGEYLFAAPEPSSTVSNPVVDFVEVALVLWEVLTAAPHWTDPMLASPDLPFPLEPGER